MDQESQLEQGNINKVWEGEWKKGGYSAKSLFGHRLFVEGYPVFRKYIPNDAKYILDIGGGTGRYGVSFAREFPNAKAYITDILEGSLSVAKKLAEEVGVTNVETQKEDVTKLTFPDNMFDVVFCDVVIQHVPDAARAMSEMARVLRPGGTLIVSVNNTLNIHTLVKKIMGKSYKYGYEKSYTPEELGELVRTAGCDVVALDGFYPAYGIYRLKEHGKPFAILGRAINRINKMIDLWTGRYFSRHFGFEIFVVATKK